jgi:hypothetical protein
MPFAVVVVQRHNAGGRIAVRLICSGQITDIGFTLQRETRKRFLGKNHRTTSRSIALIIGQLGSTKFRLRPGSWKLFRLIRMSRPGSVIKPKSAQLTRACRICNRNVIVLSFLDIDCPRCMFQVKILNVAIACLSFRQECGIASMPRRAAQCQADTRHPSALQICVFCAICGYFSFAVDIV